MTTPVSAILGLLLTFLFSCKHAINNDRQAANSTLADTNATNWSYSRLAKELITGRNSVVEARDSTTNSPCSFNKEKILSNKNLPVLLSSLENTELAIYRTKIAIPKAILNFLKCTQKGNFTIANPGEDWQETDVILNKNLPRRQLVFFGISDSIALLVHYTGGIGKSEHILIFKLAKDSITDFWCGTILADLEDKQEIIAYLKRNKDKAWGLNTNIIYF